MIKQYRKKLVVIEAVELTWGGWNDLCEFLGDEPIRGGWIDPASGSFYEGNSPPAWLSFDGAEIGAVIKTLEGDMVAREGDYIIKGVNGEFYPCKPDIFAKTYEEIA